MLRLRPELEKLEALLHYFNVTCAPAVAGMDTDKRLMLLANVCCVAAEAFASRKRTDVTTASLLLATKPYFDEISAHLGTAMPDALEAWINFDAVAAKPRATREVEADDQLLPKVILYDEAVGAPVDAQDTREHKVTAAGESVAIPWKEWLQSSPAQALGSQGADVAAVMLVLRSLHYNGKVCANPIEVLLDLDTKHRALRASVVVEAGGLELPPCVPVSGRPHATSTHPQRVPITVTNKELVARRVTAKQDAVAGTAMVERSTTYYLHPEYKVPSDETSESAVADGVGPQAHIWRWSGDESLHPFWAVQRLSAADLKKKNAQDRTTYQFNACLKEKQYNVVTVGDLRGHSVSMTVTVTVPVITNSADLAIGEVLLLEVAPKAAPPKRKDTSWKDEARAKAKAKLKPAVPKQKAAAQAVIEQEV